MNRIKTILILSLLIIGSCKNLSKKEATENIPLFTNDIPSSFIDFYSQFHQDEAFQLSHIVFPLDGARQDTSGNALVNYKWQKSDWQMHRPFDSHGGTFERKYLNLKNIIIEKIQSTNGGQFSMERRFSQLNKEWHLIYYSNFQLVE